MYFYKHFVVKFSFMLLTYDFHSITDTLSPADVALKEELLDDDLEHGKAQPITYLEVYKCHSSTVSSSIFLC